MTDNSFDKFVKEKLENYSSPVPPDMWDKVRPQVTGSSKGFFSAKRLIITLILLISAIGIGYFILDESNISNQTTKKEERAPKPFSEGKSVTTEKPANAPPPDQESTGHSNQNAIHRNEGSIKESEDHKTVSGSNLTARLSTPQALNHKREVPSTIKSKAEENGKSFGNLSGSPLLPSPVTVNRNKNEGFESNYSPLLNIGTLLAKQENKTLQLQPSRQIAQQLKNIGCVVDCPPVKSAGKNDLYIEIFASPDYAIKRTTGNVNTDPAYLQRKDSSETIGAAFTAGFRLGKSLGEKLVIKTGLQYSHINEQFRYRSENEKRSTTVITVHSIVRSPGDTVRVSDTSSFVQAGYIHKVSSNTYKSFDVPILLGYEWGSGKFKTSVNAGVVLNLYASQSGQLLDSGYVPVPLNNANIFKNNFGLGFYAGFSLIKIVRQKEFFAEPHFRYNLSNMTKDNGTFNQKFNAAGINIGIRYNLNNQGQRYRGR